MRGGNKSGIKCSCKCNIKSLYMHKSIQSAVTGGSCTGVVNICFLIYVYCASQVNFIRLNESFSRYRLTRAIQTLCFSENTSLPLALLNSNARNEMTVMRTVGVKYACFVIFYDTKAGVSTRLVEVKLMMCNVT